jgi:DNA replication and repair protein RecF
LRIDNLQIKNFRNLEKIDCHPHEHLNIFTGNNAQGKTNILEAVYVLAAGGSFRSASDADMVRYQSNGYFIKSRYLNIDRKIEASLHYPMNGQKNLTFNHKKANLSHPDRLRVVLFSPDDLSLVKGPPTKRRNFLDFILKQLSEEYLYNLDNYSKILKKRNLLLKNEQTNSNAFTIINALFIENAVKIILQRINFINLLDEITSPIYLESNGGSNELKIRYALSFLVNNDKINLNILKNAMDSHISQNLDNEIRRKKSLVGPHLDDVHFYQDGKIARVFSSQGQQRNMVVSLMLAEMYAFKRIKGFYPIFLLDEVLAELDENKKSYLIKKLANAPFQTFLSSVNFEKIDDLNSKIYQVRDGQLS